MEILEKLNLKELDTREVIEINGGAKSGWWYISYAIAYLTADIQQNGIGGIKDSNGWGAHGP